MFFRVPALFTKSAKCEIRDSIDLFAKNFVIRIP